jgi:integrase/recombinase XerD
MTKVNAKNERTKRSFFRYLKNADGCCDSTINNIESAILLWQEFSKDEDFALFNPDKAIAFKQWLAKRVCRGKAISLVTYHSYLRYLRKFFVWLVRETGYRSRIKPNAVDYLKVTEREERMATQSMPRNYPSLAYVKQLVDSIKVTNEIDQRDRALISFTLLSGMRDKAIATLPLGCFDDETLTITQNPRRGVDTKFAKLIPTTLFRFDEQLFQIVIDWPRHLRLKGFGSQDPLFPRSRLEKGKDGLTFEAANEVEPVFWQGTGRVREIFKVRSEKAGLPYFQPHTFRHLAINLAFKACKNGEEIKAISQNFGHEHIPTTLAVYGNYPPSRLAEIITTMDFSGKPQPSVNEQIEAIKKLIESQNR